MGSDGSYNESLANDVCSSASLIRCNQTGNSASVTWVERSNSHTADNYRAELLGAVALQIMVNTAIDGKYVSMDMRLRFGCDNRTVVFHGNHPRRPMPEKQAQADVLRHFKKLIRDSPCKHKMYHVYGHLDELLPLSELTPEEQVNLACDHLADAALIEGIETGRFIDRVLPDEDLVVTVDGNKISGPPLPQSIAAGVERWPVTTSMQNTLSEKSSSTKWTGIPLKRSRNLSQRCTLSGSQNMFRGSVELITCSIQCTVMLLISALTVDCILSALHTCHTSRYGKNRNLSNVGSDSGRVA